MDNPETGKSTLFQRWAALICALAFAFGIQGCKRSPGPGSASEESRAPSAAVVPRETPVPAPTADERTPQTRESAEDDASALVCAISAKASYVSGEPVEIGFTLTNRSGGRLFVLQWYTPIEGLAGDIFQVLHDGQEIPYRGLSIKRGNPEKGAYVEVAAGGAVSASVDLTRGYDCSQLGEYRVTYRHMIGDVCADEASLPRPIAAHQSIELVSNTVVFQVVNPQ